MPGTAACIIAAEQGFMSTVLQAISVKMQILQKHRNQGQSIQLNFVWNAKCCKEKISSKITCVRERMHFLSGLVNVASERKSIWKEREAKSLQLRTCISRDTIKKYLMQTITALW